MEYKGHRLRHENKYLISYKEYYILAAAFAEVLDCDTNANSQGYFIRSLYFDDVFSGCYDSKLGGEQRRRKYRIRIYNNSDKTIKFEIKDKFDSYISKRSALISRQQCEMMMQQDYSFMIDSDSAVLRAGFIEARSKLLRPCVITDYYREAYVCDEGNVRVTFDSELRTAVNDINIFDKSLITIPAMPPGVLTLEVKYDDYLPNTVRRVLSRLNSCRTSLSKFAMCSDAQRFYYGRKIINESL